uniref:Chitin-binding type-2 domain-containing protein n=1 Tax=Angiostrongylus cantonensis TaxID=6313 RepID=A0A0K0DL94_ANGCA
LSFNHENNRRRNFTLSNRSYFFFACNRTIPFRSYSTESNYDECTDDAAHPVQYSKTFRCLNAPFKDGVQRCEEIYPAQTFAATRFGSTKFKTYKSPDGYYEDESHHPFTMPSNYAYLKLFAFLNTVSGATAMVEKNDTDPDAQRAIEELSEDEKVRLMEDTQGKTASSEILKEDVQGKSAASEIAEEDVQGESGNSEIMEEDAQGEIASNEIVDDNAHSNR